MSKEGSTYIDPIKSYKTGENAYLNTGMIEKVYNEQKPGTFYQDMGHYGAGYDFYQQIWFCTKYQTQEFEPVWVLYVDGKATTTYAIFAKVGKIGTDIIETNVTNSDKNRKISLEKLNNRYGYRDAYSHRKSLKWGAYVFIGLSAKNIALIEKKTGTGTTTATPATTATTAVVTPQTNVETTNSANSSTTAGRSGSGKNNEETSNSPRTVTNAEKAWALNNPAGVDFTPKKAPKKSSKSNKSSRNNAPQKNPNNGLSTVTIKKMPEKIYSNGIKFTNTNPYIEQRYTIPGPINSEGVSEIRQIVRRHIFDIIPNTFEFNNLSSTWEEVPRNGNFNMIDWSKYNLTKVGFKFLIQGTRTDTFNFEQQKKADGSLIPIPPPISTIVNDGMSISIDEQVANIRQIGAAPYPVRLYNLNTLLTDEYRFPYESPGKGILWVISDMNITASRVTPKAKNIAVAEVSISLIEYPEIGRDIIFLPPLVPTQPVPKCVGKKCKTTTTTPLGLQVEGTYGYVPKNDLQSPSPSQPDTTPA